MTELDSLDVGVSSTNIYDGVNSTKLIAICNLPGHATGEEVCTLFAFFGEIETFSLYPTDESISANTKIAYMRYFNPEHCAGAVHLTNTVLLDRPLIVIPIPEDIFPDEKQAIIDAQKWSAGDIFENVYGLNLGTKSSVQLNLGFPHAPPKPNYDPKLPPLTLSELYRTIYIGNVHQEVSAEAILTLFSGVGEVKYVRIGSLPDTDLKYSLVEFTDVSTVPLALQYHNFPLYGVPIKTDYAKITINKGSDRRKHSRRSRSSSRGRYRGSPRYSRNDSDNEWRRNRYEDYGKKRSYISRSHRKHSSSDSDSSYKKRSRHRSHRHYSRSPSPHIRERSNSSRSTSRQKRSFKRRDSSDRKSKSHSKD